jgi:ElaB/YqjD/DUF883 family membrane-anchored ribosome-binding protein
MESHAKSEADEFREKLDALKQNFDEVAQIAKKQAVEGTADWIKEHPYQAIGIGAGVGFVIGLLVGRKIS